MIIDTLSVFYSQTNIYDVTKIISGFVCKQVSLNILFV